MEKRRSQVEFQLVPKEPTEAMIDAGANVPWSSLHSEKQDFRLRYIAAVAAAPSLAPMGVEEMREAAAKVAETLLGKGEDYTASEYRGAKEHSEDIAAAIRALPLPAAPPAADIDETAKAVTKRIKDLDREWTKNLSQAEVDALRFDAIATALRAERERLDYVRRRYGETAEMYVAEKARADAAEAQVKILQQAVENIGHQQTSAEVDDVGNADFIGGWDTAIKVARAALAMTPSAALATKEEPT